MRLASYLGLFLLLTQLGIGPAQAETACTPGTDGVGGRDAFSATPCDTNYRDEELSCEKNRTVWGACPPKPIAHKRTALLSFKDLSSYLWYSLPSTDPDAVNRKYDGPMYRGTKGSYRLTDQMISADDAKSKNRFAGCIHQIEIRGDPAGVSLRDKARLIRLQLDNCANQYILQAALHPSRQEEPRMMVSSRRCTKDIPLSAKIACQPLDIEISTAKNDYSVTPYIESAWGRTLQHVKEEDTALPDSIRAGTTKYKGYIIRKRGFGPFDGILGSIFQIINTLRAIKDGLSRLQDLQNLEFKMPDFNRAMASLKERFSREFANMQETFTNFPAKIDALQNRFNATLARLGDNMSMDRAFDSVGRRMDQMQRDLMQRYQDLPAEIQSSMDRLPGYFNDFGRVTASMADMPGALNTLSMLSPDFANIRQNMETIQMSSAAASGPLGGPVGGLGNGSGAFSSATSALSRLARDRGPSLATGVLESNRYFGAAAPLLTPAMSSGISTVLGGVGNPNVNSSVASQLTRDRNLTSSVAASLGGQPVPTQAIDELSETGTKSNDIPNNNMLVNNLLRINSSANSLQNISSNLENGTLGRTLTPENVEAYRRVAAAQQSMQQLENRLQNMHIRSLAGERFGDLSPNQIQNYRNTINSHNNLLRSMDFNTLSGMLSDGRSARNAMGGDNLPGFGNIRNMQSYARNVADGSVAMREARNISGQVRSARTQALAAAGLDFSAGSIATKMGVRKDSLVFARLPEGTIIRNPIPTPQTMPDIKISQLAAFPYEQIIDPTHPFSPRHHYYINDRDGYSPWGEKYSKDEKNNVFCAGEAKDNPYTPENEVIKVDVLESRRKKFETGENALYDGIYQRTQFNEYCYKNKGLQRNPCEVKIRIPPLPPVTWPLPCMMCFNLKPNKPTNKPPCATTHLGKDRRMAMSPIKGFIGDFIAIIGEVTGYFDFKIQATDAYYKPVMGDIEDIPVPSIGMLFSVATGAAAPPPLCLISKLGCPAACSVQNVYRKSSIQKLCRDLRAPYTPLNKLKMRFAKREKDEQEFPTQPSTPQNPSLQNELPSGVNDGLMYKDHFENRMPYPRLWDTGKSIQLTPSTLQNPRDQNGRFTSIVGVGREAVLAPPQGQPAQPNAPAPPTPRKDERCLIGGWGEDYSSSLIDIKQHDPITSWTELKLYQARTLRDYGMNCLGRYERLFKPLSQEDHVLALSGATYNERSDSCKIEAGTTTDRNVKFQMLDRNYPKSWRGYVADPGLNENESPAKFPSGNPPVLRGLDNARQGDIIILPNGTETEAGKKGLPILSYVITANLGQNCARSAGCFLTVVERNYGKWPDSCGNTDSIGIESNRQMYKPGTMPESIKKQIQDLGGDRNITCSDNDLQHCELSEWGSAELYRIRDERSRGGNTNPITPVAP